MVVGTLKYIDGLLGLLLGILWGCRQFALARSYDALSKYDLAVMRKASFVLLLSVVFVGTAFTIYCLAATQEDFAAPVTITVVVGQLVAWALETRTQSWPYDWLLRVQALRTMTRYRVGKWPPENSSNQYLMKEAKRKEKGYIECIHSTWVTYRSEVELAGHKTYRYYTRSWDDRNRHYNGNIVPCQRAIEHADKWAAAAACASMMVSWLITSKIDYCIDVIYDDTFAGSGSVRACAKSWQKEHMKNMLLEHGHPSQNAAKIVELAVCWLEKPLRMLEVLHKLEDILSGKHMSDTTYDPRCVIDSRLYL